MLEPSFRGAYQNTNRWFTTIINQPHVKAVVGDFKLCEKMAQFDNKKFQEMQAASGKGGKKQEKPPQEKKEKQQQPKVRLGP